MIANAAEVKRSKFFSNSRRGIVQIKRGGDHGYQIGGGREKLRGGRNLSLARDLLALYRNLWLPTPPVLFSPSLALDSCI
jgi:hypothetical protein